MNKISAVAAFVLLSSGLALQAQHAAQEIEFPSGFQVPGMVLNGSAILQTTTFPLDAPVLQLTGLSDNEAGSAFYHLPINIQAFTTDFNFIDGGGAAANGFTFTIQNTGPTALGGDGSGLGYVTIHHSVALKFDLYDTDGDGTESTGVYTAGNLPTIPAVDISGTGINLHKGHLMAAHITYDGVALVLTLTDVHAAISWSHSFLIDIPAAVFGDTAYVGFTGSTGGATAQQLILGWTFFSPPDPYDFVFRYPPYVFEPNYPVGLDAGSLALNGSAALDGTDLVLTNGGQNEAGSAFFTYPVSIENYHFQTLFSFQIPESGGNGFTFTIQNTGPNALGGDGAGLGFVTIHHSLAVKFGLYGHDGGGSNSVGVYTAGNLPDTPDIDLSTSGIDLHSGHIFNTFITYAQTAPSYESVLSLVLYDTVTQTTFTHAFTLDEPLPNIVFGEAAYVGFTAGTGAATSNPTIKTWTACSSECAAQSVVFVGPQS